MYLACSDICYYRSLGSSDDPFPFFSCNKTILASTGHQLTTNDNRSTRQYRSFNDGPDSLLQYSKNCKNNDDKAKKSRKNHEKLIRSLFDWLNYDTKVSPKFE